ncbi:MAG TPA: biopolymer transporter ExbD [Planctomycetota bacterium]|nr:biopolymer transporter ExbD [Planctomycetota bacterium]
MKHARRRRRRARIVVPVASMADIAFQLIIFFMICSNFAKEAGIPVKPPSAPNLERLRQSRTVVAIDADGQIYVQGRRVPDARSAETELADLLRTARTAEARTVLFRCDRTVGREVFEPVLDAITRGGGVVAAIGEREEGKRPSGSQETRNGK